MIWLYIAIIAFIFLILLIIFTKLTVKLNFFHHNDNDELTFEFRIWFGLIKYKLKIPLIKIDDNSPSVVLEAKTQLGEKPDANKEEKNQQVTPKKLMDRVKDFNEIVKHVIGMNVIITKFLKKITIKQFEWHSLIGVGDAAHTGVMSGALWTIKGGMVGLLSQFFTLKNMPVLTVTPHFQFTVIQTRLTCIFQFRIGNAILAGLKLIKYWKGGRPNLRMNAAYSREKTKSV